MKKPQRFIPVPTPESLARAALSYLGRYAASEASLRHALHNRLRRTLMRNPALAHDAERLSLLNNAIEMIIEKHRKSGVLNDATYAETKVNSLRRIGRSRRFIEQTLGQKGVRHDLTQSAFEKNESDGNQDEAEVKAARILARRRRLGPFRIGKTDDDRRRKDLASLARAGFSLEVARRVLGKETIKDEGSEDY